MPRQYRNKLRGYSLAIVGALDPEVSRLRLDNGNAAVVEFSEMLDELINYRRANPERAEQGEVLEALIFGEFEGRRLTQEELIQNCIFLLNAGHETTTSLMANGVGMLLQAPDQLQLLRDRLDLVPNAVEEITSVGSRMANAVTKSTSPAPFNSPSSLSTISVISASISASLRGVKACASNFLTVV